jgi:hypothetical protein
MVPISRRKLSILRYNPRISTFRMPKLSLVKLERHLYGLPTSSVRRASKPLRTKATGEFAVLPTNEIMKRDYALSRVTY